MTDEAKPKRVPFDPKSISVVVVEPAVTQEEILRLLDILASWIAVALANSEASKVGEAPNEAGPHSEE